MKTCAICHKEGKALSSCCKQVVYCGQACADRHYGSHKMVCIGNLNGNQLDALRNFIDKEDIEGSLRDLLGKRDRDYRIKALVEALSPTDLVQLLDKMTLNAYDWVAILDFMKRLKWPRTDQEIVFSILFNQEGDQEDLLDQAVYIGSHSLVLHITSLYKSVDPNGRLLTAIKAGNLQLVQYFLDHGARLDGGDTHDSPIIDAAHQGQLGIFKWLLNQTEYEKRTLLAALKYATDPEIVRLLQERLPQESCVINTSVASKYGGRKTRWKN